MYRMLVALRHLIIHRKTIARAHAPGTCACGAPASAGARDCAGCHAELSIW